MIKKYFLSFLVAIVLPVIVFAQDKSQAPQKVYHFVFFEPGRANIAPGEWNSLENLIWDLKTSGVSVTLAEVHGYADGVSEKKNPKLSSDRSAVVKEMLGGFGINNVVTTSGNATSGKDAPMVRRRATVCIHYTGTLKRTQAPVKTETMSFDPNFDKTIISTPTGQPAKPTGVKEEPKTETKPVPPAPAKTKTSKSGWD
ncbi:MAG: hypothetical protein K1X92_16155 [Bacteroidia bacterium]|nr:hypothetical protein [Bacteroidia bacterium]